MEKNNLELRNWLSRVQMYLEGSSLHKHLSLMMEIEESKHIFIVEFAFRH